MGEHDLQVVAFSFPDREMAITVSSGKPTPVSKKPIIAGQKFSPAFCSSIGGKIKLPAPKNKENSIRPVKKTCFFDTVFIVFASFFVNSL